MQKINEICYLAYKFTPFEKSLIFYIKIFKEGGLNYIKHKIFYEQYYF